MRARPVACLQKSTESKVSTLRQVSAAPPPLSFLPASARPPTRYAGGVRSISLCGVLAMEAILTSAESTTTTAGVSVWPRFPVIYEVNTWIWLTELSRKYQRVIDLSCVPSADWDAVAGRGIDAVWLMGVWERSPAGAAIAQANRELLDEFRRALADFRPEDNVGSPYCVRRYVVDLCLGGPDGLAIARQELRARGANLILDFVPNHVAPDHSWVSEHPEYFIQGSAEDAKTDPKSFQSLYGNVIACGRDPFFPAWPDVVQLNAFHPGLRLAVVDTITSIAEQCDGIRCDMAMLFLNSVFERTWGPLAGSRPATEYWADLIAGTKKNFSDFLFIAEAYWDLEWELQQQGFDACYDKKLYDRLEHDNAESVYLHLCADQCYQEKLVRFIENHDEPRAASVFSPEKERAAALTMSTLPGMRLFYEGQFEGRKVRPPVFLARRPSEPSNPCLQSFYRKLLEVLDESAFHDGQWTLCMRTGWPDNATFKNLVAWSWVLEDYRCLIVVNLSNERSQARIHVDWSDRQRERWTLSDVLSGAIYERDAQEMLKQGLYVDLEPWQYHFLEITA